MRVWLMTVGEPLVCDPRGARLLRTGILADLLVRNGHSVVFWSSTFDHVKKNHRASRDTKIDVRPGYTIRLLHSLGYQSNVSFRRIMNHRGVAAKFRLQAPLESRPDVIVCSLPTLELCGEAVKFGQHRNIPVVLDVRDLWPDLFLDLFPRPLRSFGSLLISPMYRQVRTACSGATAITGSTDEYVDWALEYAARPRTRWDQHFPMAYADASPNRAQILGAEAFWKLQGISKERDEFIACWFGMIGKHSELDTVIDATRRLAAAGKPVRTVLCGTGPSLDKFRKLASSCPQVVFPGWVNSAQIWTLLRMSSVGLAPYVSNQNYIHNVPNKPIEYLSAGLPVVSSLQGALARLLSEHDCGLTYTNADAEQLADTLAKLHDQRLLRDRMAANARRLYQDQFVAERVYVKMQNYLQQIAGQFTAEYVRAA